MKKTNVSQSRIGEICARGERADELLLQGKTREALKACTDLVKELEKTGDFDSYLAARLTLSTLRCHVKLADFKGAFAIWNAAIEDSLYGVGIYALESAQTTVRDMIAYDMICAFLHTVADNEKPAAAAAVNQYLSRVCEYATEQNDRPTMKLALNNWKQHLREIFSGSIPFAHATALIAFEKSYGEPVLNIAIEFPVPTAWAKPNDFQEMSRVVKLKVAPPKSRKNRAS